MRAFSLLGVGECHRASLHALGSMLFVYHFKHTGIEVVAQRLGACLVGKECAHRFHLRRDILLTEEGTQDTLLFEGRLCVPIALHELFDVLVVHIALLLAFGYSLLAVFYIKDVCQNKKLQEFLKFFANCLPGPENIDFHLFFCDVENGGNILIALALHIAQLHTTTLLFRQCADELSHQSDPIVLDGLFLWIGSHTVVVGLDGCIQRLRLIVHASHLVQRQVTTDGQTEGFYRVYLFPTVAFVPDLHHRFLHHILRLRRIHRDAERHSVEFILQRQDVGLEINHWQLAVGFWLLAVGF